MRAVVLAGSGVVAAVLLAVAGCSGPHPDSGARGAATVAAPATTSRTPASTISQADAERFAAAAIPDGSVVAAWLDSINGTPTWAVRLATPTGPVEVYVDLISGAVRTDVHGDRERAGSAMADSDGTGTR